MLFLETIHGRVSPKPPLWMMRQAGRYLSGYQKKRQEHQDFLSLCFDHEAASDVALEPIERFDFDTAILFSDILTVPLGFSQSVKFEKGIGPLLGTLPPASTPFSLDFAVPIFKTVQRTKEKLPAHKPLLGFSGSPWTLFSYMVEGGGSKTFEEAKTHAYGGLGQRWMEKLSDAVFAYLEGQIHGGCDAVMLFDSWAGHLPFDLIEDFLIQPHERLVTRLRKTYPQVPIILFPRKVPLPFLIELHARVRPHVLAVDNTLSPEDYAKAFSKETVLQIGPDPVLLKVGGDPLKKAVKRIKTAMDGRPYIMNLAHGVLPTTPVENVLDFVRWTREV